MNPGACAHDVADRIDAVLPQTQCRRCGYDGCRPYAAAVAAGEAINRCPPGGEAVIAALAALTGRPIAALDSACGVHGPLRVARIDESRCIGCTLCIAACPVDAIVGAQKRMHTVLPVLCSGCELCLPPCPVDCIAMVPAGRLWSAEDARAARMRFEARGARLGGGRAIAAESAAATAAPASSPVAAMDEAQRRDEIAAALARARARRVRTPA